MKEKKDKALEKDLLDPVESVLNKETIEVIFNENYRMTY